MKQFIILLMFLYAYMQFAQSDPNADPNWDWRNGDIESLVYPISQYRIYKIADNGNTVPLYISAPWSQYNAVDQLDDNKPEDGWVLVSRDFGTPLRGVLGADGVTQKPYFALYNRYTSMLRVFILVKCQDDYEHGGIVMKFGSLTKTATFANLRPLVYAADRIDILGEYSATALVNLVGNDMWIWGDFVLAYDPTMVRGNATTGPRMQFRVFGTKEYELMIDGTLAGIQGPPKYVRDFLCNDENGKITIAEGILTEENKELSFNDRIVNAMATADKWSDLKKQIESRYNSVPSYDKNTTEPFQKIANDFKGLLGSIKDSWLVSALPVIGAVSGIVDFFIGGGKKSGNNVSPTYFGANLKLTGSIKTNVNLPAGATIPIPGSRTDPAEPVMSVSTPLLYNNPTGLFTLKKTPVLQYKIYTIEKNLINDKYPFLDIRIKDTLDLAINKENGLVLDSIKAYICADATDYIRHPFGIGEKGMMYDARYMSEKVLNKEMEVEYVSKTKFIFRSIPVNAFAFKYQKICFPTAYLDYIIKWDFSECNDITIKIIGYFHRKDAPEAVPLVAIQTFVPKFEDCGQGKWPEVPSVKKITVKKQFEFDDSESYVKYFYSNESANTIKAEETITKNNKKYYFTGWDDGNLNAVRTIGKSFDYTALYKASMLSNYAECFNNQGQHKFITTAGSNPGIKDIKRLVYESSGLVWMESQTNGGIFKLGKDGGHINNFKEAKSPSFDPNKSDIFRHIIYQYNNGIKVDEFTDEQGMVNVYKGSSEVTNGYCYNAYMDWNTGYDMKPVIVSGNNGKVLAVWRDYGIWYRLGTYTPTSTEKIYWYGPPEMIDFSAYNSDNPCVAAHPGGNTFYIAWQNGKLIITLAEFELNESLEGLKLKNKGSFRSSAMGCNSISKPVLAVNLANESDFKLAFIGEKSGSGKIHLIERNRIASFGEDVTGLAINCINNKTIVSYSEGGKTQFGRMAEFVNQYPKITNTNTIGKIMQSPSSLQDKACVLSLNTTKTPYNFNYFESVVTPKLAEVFEGKEAVIECGESALYYGIANIVCDGNSIGFKHKTDSSEIKTDEDLIRETSSSSFKISQASDLRFNVYYGICDSLKIKEALKDSSRASFEVELADAVTGELIGKCGKIEINSENMIKTGSSSFKIITSGINGTRNALIRIKAVSNFASERNVISVYKTMDSTAFAQTDKEIMLDLSKEITEYELAQNFPNPFNPATIIKYSIPESGFVKLVVYDILGQEVCTPVNTFHLKGKHEVRFDASGLASGLYIYKIQAGKFTQTKKMLLLK